MTSKPDDHHRRPSVDPRCWIPWSLHRSNTARCIRSLSPSIHRRELGLPILAQQSVPSRTRPSRPRRAGTPAGGVHGDTRFPIFACVTRYSSPSLRLTACCTAERAALDARRTWDLDPGRKPAAPQHPARQRASFEPPHPRLPSPQGRHTKSGARSSGLKAQWQHPQVRRDAMLGPAFRRVCC